MNILVSTNADAQQRDFEKLLEDTTKELNKRARSKSVAVQDLYGTKLEGYSHAIMTELAVGTDFEDSIKLIGGLKFPDIVANRFYGVEVKTTKHNHWKTTGNSILESTRVKDVERIFMLFGKLGEPVEFRYRAYEECLSEVVVTHSPRYLIDMELVAGQTIFDKINTTYDCLRKLDNPIEPITDYYRKNLKTGQDLWWIQNNEKPSNLVITLWNHLDKHEKQKIMFKAMVFFPEIFSDSSDKYARFCIWLITKEAIICPNVRDIFTAGGKEDFKVKEEIIKNLPKIVYNLFDNIDEVVKVLVATPAIELSDYWQNITTEERKISDWFTLIRNNSEHIKQHLELALVQCVTEFTY